MNPKTKTKCIAYGILLTVCTLMVIVDNTLLAPQNTHANTTPPTPPTPSAAPAGITAPLPTTSTAASTAPQSSYSTRHAITERLAQYANAHPIHTSIPDAFAPPADWLPVKEEAPGLPTSEPTPVTRTIKPHNLTLNAVMINPQGSVAIINGKHLRVGQSVNGYIVQAITQKQATLGQDDHTITLKLHTPVLTPP